MPLDHYVTLGRSGLRVQPILPRRHDLRRRPGLGSQRRGLAKPSWTASSSAAATSSTPPTPTPKGHSEKIIGDHLGHDRQQARPAGHRHEVQRQPVRRRSQRRRLEPQGDPRRCASSRSAGCAPTTSISTGCTTGTSSRPSRRPWRRSTISCQSGKVRYIGVSDTPAWKVTQAQLIASFRGWAPFIALQIEYSLLERTVEGRARSPWPRSSGWA